MVSQPVPDTAPALSRAEALARLTRPGEDYELVDGEVLGRRCKVFVNAPPTLRHLFDQARSDATFLVYLDAKNQGEADRMSFEASWQRAAAFASALVEDFGVERGDRVAISLRNYPDWILAYMATVSVGAVAVAMNAWWTPSEMAYGLVDSGAKVLVADTERIDRFEQIEPHEFDGRLPAIIACRDPRAAERHTRYPAFDQLVAARLGTPMPTLTPSPSDPGSGLVPEPDDIASIMYTSGSTGHPKGVASCHHNIVSALLSWELDAAAAALVAASDPTATPRPTPDGQDATLLAVPLFHATGSHAAYLSSYRAQRKIVLMHRWDPGRAAELVEAERVVSFFGPAAMTSDLVAEATRTDRDLSSLLAVGGGGAPRPPAQVADIGSTFDRALPNTGWGMTETNAIGAGISGHDYLDHPASSGRCSAVLELRVVDEDGQVLADGQRGELQVRGTSIFRGYWNRPDADAETFVAADDGGAPWMRTGDMAYLDEEGYLYIVDRIKDLVIRGGENIGCGEVEAALIEHPAVVEACVYAVPDDRLGEEVGATVYPAGPVTAESLQASLVDRLAAFQIPRYIRLADGPLPRTASGKILKREIRSAAWEELGVQPQGATMS